MTSGSGIARLAKSLFSRRPRSRSLPLDRAVIEPLFDRNWYLAVNPDVAEAGIDPFTHYIEHGWREERSPNPFIDTAWYRSTYPDVEAVPSTLLHYIEHGWREGRAPGPDFDGAAYLQANPDVAEAGFEPLNHYLLHGRAEGRAPGADSDGAAHRQGNPDGREAGFEPLGRQRGRAGDRRPSLAPALFDVRAAGGSHDPVAARNQARRNALAETPEGVRLRAAAARRSDLFRARDAILTEVLDQSPLHRPSTDQPERPIIGASVLEPASGMFGALAGGWHEPEVWGVWSFERTVHLEVRLEPTIPPPVTLALEVVTVIPPCGRQVVEIMIGYETVSLKTFTVEEQKGVMAVQLQARMLAVDGRVRLTLRVSHPTTSSANDMRILGVGLKAMWLDH